MEHIEYTLALSRVPRLGPKRCRHLIRIFGEAKKVFEADRRSLLRLPYINSNLADLIKKKGTLDEAKRVVSEASLLGIKAMDISSEEYPYRLRHTPHAPLVLFYKGEIDWNNQRTMAIVGTRKPTSRGLVLTRQLVEALSPLGVTIVSGLAYGIDVCAHRSCVQHQVPTIAVLGGAIDKIYPAQHKSLLHKMMMNGGAVSEFPPGVKAEREYFPMRNRIIAGMADLVVVVESGLKGGSMITARMANDYNREVGAFPGRTEDDKSSGCNELIKQNEAHLLESAADVMALMQWDQEENLSVIKSSIAPPEDERSRQVYQHLKGKGPMHVDRLSAELKLSPGDWSVMALNLEMSGHIIIKPGNLIEAQ